MEGIMTSVAQVDSYLFNVHEINGNLLLSANRFRKKGKPIRCDHPSVDSLYNALALEKIENGRYAIAPSVIKSVEDLKSHCGIEYGSSGQSTIITHIKDGLTSKFKIVVTTTKAEPKKEMKNILDGVKSGDGAHCGLTDRYPDIEAALESALATTDAWTTGWYSSKKAIATCRITRVGELITVEVIVSDDLDTEGLASITINESTIEAIDNAITEAWELAEQDQKANRDYTGYSIIDGIRWIETYIQQRNDGWMMDEPPGDNYHQWGFQNEGNLTDEEKEAIEDMIESNDWETDKEVTVGKYTVKVWND
jgi:hypothetical protein